MCKNILLAATAAVLLFSSIARADSLIGSTVTASLQIPDRPSAVTQQFAPTATVGAGTEFNGTITLDNLGNDYLAVDFSSNALTLTVTRNALTAFYGYLGNIALTFTDDAFTASFLMPANNYFGDIASTAFSNHTLTVNLIGVSTSATYVFAQTALAATPEPSSFVLLSTGALGALAAARRRFA